MAQALCRFYAELNELLPRRMRQGETMHAFTGPASIKDHIRVLDLPTVQPSVLGGTPRPAHAGMGGGLVPRSHKSSPMTPAPAAGVAYARDSQESQSLVVPECVSISVCPLRGPETEPNA